MPDNKHNTKLPTTFRLYDPVMLTDFLEKNIRIEDALALAEDTPYITNLLSRYTGSSQPPLDWKSLIRELKQASGVYMTLLSLVEARLRLHCMSKTRHLVPDGCRNPDCSNCYQQLTAEQEECYSCGVDLRFGYDGEVFLQRYDLLRDTPATITPQDWLNNLRASIKDRDYPIESPNGEFLCRACANEWARQIANQTRPERPESRGKKLTCYHLIPPT